MTSRNEAPAEETLHRAGELASIFKMLGNPDRLKIVMLLGSRERTVGEMGALLGIRQPTLSQQIGELRGAAVITGRRVAKSAIYALTADRGRRALRTIHMLNDAQTSSARKLLERSASTHRSQPAAVFAAVFTLHGEALAIDNHQATRTHRSARP